MEARSKKKKRNNIPKIDLFLPPKKKSGTGALRRFTIDLAEALGGEGAYTRVIDLEKEGLDGFARLVKKQKPHVTLSFNGLLPDSSGQFLAEYLDIPHLAYVVDAPNLYASLALSSRTQVLSIDQHFKDLFSMLGCSDPLFLPHAAPSNIRIEAKENASYPLVFIGTYIDVQKRKQLWIKERGSLVATSLLKVCQRALCDQSISYYRALFEEIDHLIKNGVKINIDKNTILEFLYEVELVLRGMDRIEMVKALEGLPLHLFGGSIDEGSWNDVISKKSSITYHGPCDFDRALSVIKDSAILLNSTPSILQGLHERILYGSLQGASVVTTSSLFVEAQFSNKEISFYSYGKWEELFLTVENLLKEKKKRLRMVANAQKKILKNHTWKHRAKKILELDYFSHSS